VIGLLNIYRLLVPMVLLMVFFDAPTGRRDVPVSSRHRALFVRAGLDLSIQRRWPPAQWLALFQLAVDTVIITLQLHASGGMDSGLATLLILPAGATAAIVQPRLALLAAALIALTLLFETTVSALTGASQGADFLVAGLTGASLFAITLLAIPLAAQLRESEARVQQRDIDLANLNELNEFIVQHLRESILVVDGADQVRLINETAARMLKGGPSKAARCSAGFRACSICSETGQQDSDRRVRPARSFRRTGTVIRRICRCRRRGLSALVFWRTPVSRPSAWQSSSPPRPVERQHRADSAPSVR
jgi:two-component system sensor histidine kinase PilS (NtrC family)